MEAVPVTDAAARPIHFFCWDCGAPFTLTVEALRRGDLDPSCPVCDSLRIGADYESLVRWFDSVVLADRLEPAAGREPVGAPPG